MRYITNSPRESTLTIDYDFSIASSYLGGFINSRNYDSSTSSLLREMKFDNSLSNVYSGEIIGDYSNITGHFSEGVSSLGANFASSFYVKVHDTSAINASGGTFMFSHEKKSQGTELIFSCYDDSSGDPKGFEFGINDANKLFFECYSENGPIVFVLNNIPHKKNIYTVFVDSSNGEVVLSWWDPSLQVFESQNFLINSDYIRYSDNWIIGSGIYKGHQGINYSSNGFPCDGYIDRFLHFDDNVSHEDSALIARSFYEDFNYIEAESGTYGTYITGYNEVLTEIVSGITGYQNIITGYSGNYEKTFDYITGQNLYGTADVGEDVFEFFRDIGNEEGGITGLYKVKTVDVPTYGITGFSTGLKEEVYTAGISEPLYYYSGISGEMYRTYDHVPLYSEPLSYKKNDAYYEMSGIYPYVLSDGLAGYGPKSYTYLGARNPSKDFIETQKGVNLFSINNFGSIFPSENFESRAVVFWESDSEFDPESVSLVVNGLTKEPGDLDDFEDGKFHKSIDLDSGEFSVFTEGISEYSPTEIYYKDENLSIFVDSPVLDILKNGSQQSLKVSSLSDYYLAPFSQINPEGKNVFLNGQKIYEGVDYEIIGGEFKPIGFILSITGTYHITQGWHLDEDCPIHSNVTGLGSYDTNESQVFCMDSYVSYLNGVRLDPKSFVCHDASVDLLSQGYDFIVENQSMEIYNNYDPNVLDFNPVGGGGVTVTGNDYAIKGTVDEFGNVLDENWQIVRGVKPTHSVSDEIFNLNYEDI